MISNVTRATIADCSFFRSAKYGKEVFSQRAARPTKFCKSLMTHSLSDVVSAKTSLPQYIAHKHLIKTVTKTTFQVNRQPLNQYREIKK